MQEPQTTTFQNFGLSEQILKALTEIGFEKPTPIQIETIPHLISSKKDLIALAQTGTGKTAAYSLPIIQQLEANEKNVQALILCPTRELAIQIAGDIENYMKYLPGQSVTAVFGGERMDKQIRAMGRNPQIVVGTPGRVNDLIRRRILKLESLKWLVLDEADEMLNMGFKEELDEVLKTMPMGKQVLLFSATMNEQVRRIANNYMENPQDITVGNKNKGADNVKHFYYVVHEKDRYQALRRISDMNPDIHGIVFCRTRRETQEIADKLIQDNYSAEAIHGEISQEQRTLVMNRFRAKKIQLLIATDVAARGIDVNGLTHIINYTFPESGEAYLHRSGRTGRAHNMGISILIVNMRENYKIKILEKKIGKGFEKGKIPSGEDICAKQLFELIDKVCSVEVNEAQIGKYSDIISKKFENMDREEMMKKFISIEFNSFLEHYKDATDLNSSGGGEGRREEFDKSSFLFARFHLNIGRNLGLNVKELLTFMTDNQDLRKVEIGKIDIRKDHTLFEVDENYKNKVLDHFNAADVHGVSVKVTCEETGIKSTRTVSSRGTSSRNHQNRNKPYDRNRRSGGSKGGYRKRY